MITVGYADGEQVEHQISSQGGSFYMMNTKDATWMMVRAEGSVMKPITGGGGAYTTPTLYCGHPQDEYLEWLNMVRGGKVITGTCRGFDF